MCGLKFKRRTNTIMSAVGETDIGFRSANDKLFKGVTALAATKAKQPRKTAQ